MPRLNVAERNNAIGRLEAGQSQISVATALNVSQTTISRILDTFIIYRQRGSERDRPRSDRPRGTTASQDRYIYLRGFNVKGLQLHPLLPRQYQASLESSIRT